MSADNRGTHNLSQAQQAVYVLGKIAAALGLRSPDYAHGLVAGVRVDLGRLQVDAFLEIERLKAEAAAAQSDADGMRALLSAAKAERDEAQAEVRAMLEGRRDEEERARMRMLEKVLAASIQPKGLQATVLLPRYSDNTVARSAEEWRAALLADLDALVALGLRGEVLP